MIQGKVGQFSVGVDTGVPSVLSSRPNSRGLARLPEAVRNVDAEVRRGGRPMNADLIRFQAR
uniref:Uncharacterized protein n=1 Tax=Klebsiella pneumoniae TaxID=573 RepID=A0A2P1BNA1_KLEPN|nr:hypothetical protein [Klebsiella pneumoniae]